MPPSAVAMGDVNADGTLDLVAADWPSEYQNLAVLLGGSDGTFSQKLSIPNAGVGLYSLALGDLNGDGRLDLVGAVMDSDKVGVLLGTAGGFAARVDYPTGDHLSTGNVWSTCNPTWSPCYPRSVTLGDLNGDGETDLVVANESFGSMSILLGMGNGTFAARVDYPTASIPISVTLADLNLDGSPDVVVANHNADGVGVMLGRGDGTLVAGSTHLAADAWVREGGELGLAVRNVAQTGAHQPEVARADQIVERNRRMYGQEGEKRRFDAAKVLNNKALTFEG